MPHRQTPHRAQVAQQPSDSLLELREAGQGVGRLQFARVVQPGLQHCEEGRGETDKSCKSGKITIGCKALRVLLCFIFVGFDKVGTHLLGLRPG